jgi:hypothetical protein
MVSRWFILFIDFVLICVFVCVVWDTLLDAYTSSSSVLPSGLNASSVTQGLDSFVDGSKSVVGPTESVKDHSLMVVSGETSMEPSPLQNDTHLQLPVQSKRPMLLLPNPLEVLGMLPVSSTNNAEESNTSTTIGVTSADDIAHNTTTTTTKTTTDDAVTLEGLLSRVSVERLKNELDELAEMERALEREIQELESN